MKRILLTLLLLTLSTDSMAERKVTLMTDEALESIRATVSGATAKAHIRDLAQMHRVQGTAGYHRAAVMVQELAVTYGLEDVRIENLAADGETLYHHFRSYYGWRATAGHLWEISPGNGRLGDFSEMKVALADYSQDANVAAELVDVGPGIRPEDYEGRDIGGKIVLAGGSLPIVHRLAVEERGAVGILSYYPNQRSGWSGDDPDLVRWGHLDPSNTGNKFAFMTSPRQAHALQSRLSAGESITLKAEVEARLVPDYFEVVTGLIPGTDRAEEEIVFTCHLDHQSPGANDNASGAATILEVARTLSLLIATGKLPPPRRTIRFVWPPEISGSFAYLDRHPEIVARMKAGIHMDMVGGIPRTTKSVFFLSRPPASVPSFVGDVGEVFFEYVADGSRRAAARGDFSDVILSPEGTKEDFTAEIQGLDLGSDHQVYGDSTFRVPMLYFHDWPDIYIHTNKDVPENMDATKLQRVAFLGAATGYTLASLGPRDGATLFAETAGRAAKRMGADRARALALISESEGPGLDAAYRDALLTVGLGLERERAALESIAVFLGASESPAPWIESLLSIEAGGQIALRAAYDAMCRKHGIAPREGEPGAPSLPGASRVPERREEVPGPTWVYYYDLLEDRLGHGAADAIALPETAQFEVLNFVDGKRTVQQIRDAVSAELGPTNLEAVAAYLELLERAGAIRFK